MLRNTARINCPNIAHWRDAKIFFVQTGKFGINFRGHDTLVAEIRKSDMKAAKPREKINKTHQRTHAFGAELYITVALPEPARIKFYAIQELGPVPDSRKILRQYSICL